VTWHTILKHYNPESLYLNSFTRLYIELKVTGLKQDPQACHANQLTYEASLVMTAQVLFID